MTDKQLGKYFSARQVTLLKQALFLLEGQTLSSTGVGRISGGFARAQVKEVRRHDIAITLKWGVVSDCENRVTVEKYSLPRSALSEITVAENVIRTLKED